MPLMDYISDDSEDEDVQDAQKRDVAEFLSEFDRWHKVLDEEPVTGLAATMEFPSWWGRSFEVHDVKKGTDRIRGRFSFVAKVQDKKDPATEEEITGSAVAVIDEFDNVEYHEVEAQA